MTRQQRSRRPIALAAVGVLIAVALGAGFVIGGKIAAGSATPSPGTSLQAGVEATASPSPLPSPSPSPSPTAPPTPTPTPPPVAATTDGVLLPWSQASLATRTPIAVMIDDQALARPQSGLSQADIVYQAPAEGGIPRYMAIFQTKDPPSIGPVRSSRIYFVVWAEEWRAMYVHSGGAPNALAYLNQINGRYVWNADEYRWGGGAGYLYRVAYRFAPHNVYTTGAKMQALAKRIGATKGLPQAAWTFTDPAPLDERPIGGTIVVPYLANRIAYTYDQATNTYRRSVTGEKVQTDAGTKTPIAPTNVVVLYEHVGPLANTNPGSTNVAKGRLEIDYLGTGKATVFENGQAIAAMWSKTTESAPTLLTYASGPQAGQPVALVRGQIFVQVVATGTAVTWKPGTPAQTPPPVEPSPLLPDAIEPSPSPS